MTLFDKILRPFADVRLMRTCERYEIALEEMRAALRLANDRLEEALGLAQQAAEKLQASARERMRLEKLLAQANRSAKS